MKLLYVAGPYRSKLGIRGIQQNIDAASDAAYALWRMGAAVICPHKNTALFDTLGVDDKLWLEGDLVMMRRCDAVVMLPGWTESVGATAEYAEAKRLGMPLFSYDDMDIDVLKEFIQEKP